MISIYNIRKILTQQEFDEYTSIESLIRVDIPIGYRTYCKWKWLNKKIERIVYYNE